MKAIKGLLLGVALLGTVSCTSAIKLPGETNEVIESVKPVTAELQEGETLYVYWGNDADVYTLDGYSQIGYFGNTLTLTKVTYTYYGTTNALDVETDVSYIRYRGFSVNFNIVGKPIQHEQPTTSNPAE